MELKVFTDGGAINNPGPAAIAFVIYQEGRFLHQFSSRIGKSTNNFAEYTAVVELLKWLIKNRPPRVDKIVLNSDSSLMVNQLNGLFKVKNPAIRDFILKIRGLEQELSTPIVYKYIPREQNRLADSLVKKELLYS